MHKKMLAKFAHNHDVDEVKKLGVRPRDRFKSRFNNVLLIDATDRSKISSDQKGFFIALSLYTISFFANTPFNTILYFIFFQKLYNTANQNNSVINS